MIESYRDLRVYQISYSLALQVHRLTLGFPNFEKYELGSQLRRAVDPVNRGQKPGIRVKSDIRRRITDIWKDSRF